MPTLFGRRYVRRLQDVSNTEKVLGILILLLVAGIVAAFAVQVAINQDYLFNVDEQAYAPLTPEPGGADVDAARGLTVEQTKPLPDPGLEGWRAGRTEYFTADDLYVKIDGRAGAYLEFHVVGLTFGRYYHRSDPERSVDVYWYDMGEPANAASMYRSEEAPGATPVAIGRAGYQVAGAVFFWKGASYVQIMPSRLDDADAHAALRIAQRLAERIGG